MAYSQTFRVGRRHALIGAAVGLAAVPGAARAEWLRDEVVVYADPPLRPALQALAAGVRARSGTRVRIFCAAPGQMVELLAHGTQDDILVTQVDFLAAARRRTLLGGTDHPLWRNRLVFAASGPATRAAGGAAALPAVLGAGTLALPDATDACTIDGAALLAKLGLSAALAGRVRGAADTGDALAMLQRGEVRLALCHASEVAADPSLSVALAVPDDAYPPIVYAAALSRAGWSRYQDDFLAALIATPPATLRVLGLEPAA